MAKGIKSTSPNRKEQLWRKHIINWRESDLSQAEYCRRNELSAKSFTYWLGRIRKNPEPVCFVRVPIKPQTPDGPLSLIFGDDCRLEICDGFNPVTLENAVRVLRRL